MRDETLADEASGFATDVKMEMEAGPAQSWLGRMPEMASKRGLPS